MRQFNYIWLCKNTWLMSSNTYMGEMENFVLCWREIFTTISWGFDYLLLSSLSKGVSRSCSYDSWIYNYLCNKCLSPLKLWVRILLRRGVLDTTLCDKVCQWLAACHWREGGLKNFKGTESWERRVLNKPGSLI